MIAALYVETDGVYFGRPDVDPWDKARDARLYAGPWPVVAHPPCERWGRYWFGGPSAKVRRIKGDDGGCFSAALASVRRWGGVLEHPEASAAWAAFGLAAPPKCGGWIMADFVGGWTCCVEQGHYGHNARKATWLYTHGLTPPLLKWGRSKASQRLDAGFHSRAERATIEQRRAVQFRDSLGVLCGGEVWRVAGQEHAVHVTYAAEWDVVLDRGDVGAAGLRTVSKGSSRGEGPQKKQGRIRRRGGEAENLNLCPHGQRAVRCSSCASWHCGCPGSVAHVCAEST